MLDQLVLQIWCWLQLDWLPINPLFYSFFGDFWTFTNRMSGLPNRKFGHIYRKEHQWLKWQTIFGSLGYSVRCQQTAGICIINILDLVVYKIDQLSLKVSGPVVVLFFHMCSMPKYVQCFVMKVNKFYCWNVNFHFISSPHFHNMNVYKFDKIWL